MTLAGYISFEKYNKVDGTVLVENVHSVFDSVSNYTDSFWKRSVNNLHKFLYKE